MVAWRRSERFRSERESFSDFVHANLDSRFVPVAKRYASNRRLPTVLGNDIAAEALARIWEKAWPRLSEESTERQIATVYTFMTYVADEELKQAMRSRPALPEDLPAGVVDLQLDERFIPSSAKVALAHALAGLSPQAQRIIELAAAAGLSRGEIAVQLGITVTNVTTTLSRARETLKRKLGPNVLIELGIRTERDDEGGVR